MTNDVTLTVCETCGYDASKPDAARPGASLAQLFEAHDIPGVRLQRTRCLMSCERPCAVALQTPHKYSYVLCDLPVDNTTVEAIYRFARLYEESEDGTVAWSDWPEEVKGRFAARLPWLDTDRNSDPDAVTD